MFTAFYAKVSGRFILFLHLRPMPDKFSLIHGIQRKNDLHAQCSHGGHNMSSALNQVLEKAMPFQEPSNAAPQSSGKPAAQA